MMGKNKKFRMWLCSMLGHKFILLDQQTNSNSSFAWIYCTRCEYDDIKQWHF